MFFLVDFEDDGFDGGVAFDEDACGGLGGGFALAVFSEYALQAAAGVGRG